MSSPDEHAPLFFDPRPPTPMPRFHEVRRGYDPVEVDRWVVNVSRRLEELSTFASQAEHRLQQAELRAAQADGRADAAEAHARAAETRAASRQVRGISDRLDAALRTVLEEAGRATDAVLAEARAQAVALVASAQQQSELVVADATVQGEVAAARRRKEIDDALAQRIAEQERLAGEVEVLQAAQRLAAGSARSVLDQLGAVAAALDVPSPVVQQARVVIDLTEGSAPDGVTSSMTPPAQLPAQRASG
jgi:cell division septum initiation protein DivIVA